MADLQLNLKVWRQKSSSDKGKVLICDRLLAVYQLEVMRMQITGWLESQKRYKKLNFCLYTAVFAEVNTCTKEREFIVKLASVHVESLNN